MKKTGLIIALICLGAVVAIGATSGLRLSTSLLTASLGGAGDAQTYIDQGKFYLVQHNILTARDQFQLAVTADPNNQEANLLLGVTRVLALVEDGQTTHTGGLDSVREILELAGISFQSFNIMEAR